MFSCGSDTPELLNDDTQRPEYAEYMLGFGGKTLIGEDVDSQWKSGIGLVWLSTDDKHEGSRDLYGTLTLNIGEAIDGKEGERKIEGGILSHTDKLKGTPQELNGKTYFFTPNESEFGCGDRVVIEAATASYIKVYALCVTMQENITGEIIYINGSFTALSR